MLTRDAILSIVPSLPREEVQVPEWSDSVSVRAMNGTERDRFEVLLAKDDRANFRALLAAFSACDGSGERLFTEADVPALAAQPAAALDRIVTVAIRLSKFTSEDVDILAKNSASGPSDASS